MMCSSSSSTTTGFEPVITFMSKVLIFSRAGEAVGRSS
jgi:hypothetical protein